MSSENWVRVCEQAALQEGEVIGAVAEGRPIAVYLVEGLPYATDDICTHGEARLSEGFVIDHCVECPLHQGLFDIRTGEPMCEPVTEPVRAYRTRFEGGFVEVDTAGS